MQYTIVQSEAISNQAAATIRNMIINGQILDGERINEVQLSKKLGISRTPIREGLGQLAAEQFVRLIPRRGFFAAELSPQEFSELYDLRPILDIEALILGGQPSNFEIDAIEAANKAFVLSKPGMDAVEADEHFHRLLLARCPNSVLLCIIENLMLRTQRYELALFRETSPMQHAGDQHEKIITSLRKQNMAKAAKHLRDNLTSGKAPILAWLSARSE